MDVMDVPADTARTLGYLGLTEYEARAYYALVGMISGSATEIALASKVPRSKSYAVLRSLENKGFVDVTRGKPLTFTVVPPRKVFADHRKRLQGDIEHAENELDMLYVTRLPTNPTPMWLLKGTTRIVEKEVEIISRAREQVLIIGGLMYPGEPGMLREALEGARKRGVDVRMITREMLDVDGSSIDVQGAFEGSPIDIKYTRPPVIKALVRDHTETLGSFSQIEGGSVISGTAMAFWSQYPEFASAIADFYTLLWDLPFLDMLGDMPDPLSRSM